MFPGEGARQWWGLGEGKARGRRALPLGGSGWSRGGRRRLAGVEQGRRLVADGDGAALAVRGGGERVWELHYGKVNLAAGSIWGEEGRRRGLRVELGGGGGHGGAAGVLA